jgi:tRNA-dependent cyclodipeptide synthase
MDQMTLDQMTLRAESSAAPGSLAGANLFIPISLGNHYYSSEILRRVQSDFVAHSKFAVVFLCDRLRHLSYQIRGETDAERISASIKLQVDQLTRSLMHLGFGSYSNAVIASWSFLLDDSRYLELLAALQEFVHRDAVLNRRLEGYAAELMDRFRGPNSAGLGERIALQRQYVTEETALSLYMTEIRGFNVELYRRGMGFVDALYRERPRELMALLGKSKLERQFVSLEESIAGQGAARF